MDSEYNLDNIFLSYNKILKRLKQANITTKNNQEITMMDLMVAGNIMDKKHHICRWRSTKIKSRRYFILVEGYLWIRYVYFQKDKKQIDADIYFFESRIKEYEKLLKMENKKLFNKNMYVESLVEYFNRSEFTIKQAILKMIKIHSDYRIRENNKYLITADGIEWLCKNCFKQKYLEVLENYKMELTEEFIKAGYIYDNFFGKN